MVKKDGAIHYTRWRSAAIYTLKMFIVGSDHCKMEILKAHGVIDVVISIHYIYARYWFFVPIVVDAPYLTLMLWKDLNE